MFVSTAVPSQTSSRGRPFVVEGTGVMIGHTEDEREELELLPCVVDVRIVVGGSIILLDVVTDVEAIVTCGPNTVNRLSSNPRSPRTIEEGNGW